MLRLGSEVEVQVNSIFNLLRKEVCTMTDHGIYTIVYTIHVSILYSVVMYFDNFYKFDNKILRPKHICCCTLLYIM